MRRWPNTVLFALLFCATRLQAVQWTYASSDSEIATLYANGEGGSCNTNVTKMAPVSTKTDYVPSHCWQCSFQNNVQVYAASTTVLPRLNSQYRADDTQPMGTVDEKFRTDVATHEGWHSTIDRRVIDLVWGGLEEWSPRFKTALFTKGPKAQEAFRIDYANAINICNTKIAAYKEDRKSDSAHGRSFVYQNGNHFALTNPNWGASTSIVASKYKPDFSKVTAGDCR